MEKLTEVLKDLEQGKINVDHAESEVLRLFNVMISLPAESEIHKQYSTDRDDINAPFWDTEHIIHENSFKKEGAMWLLNKIKADLKNNENKN